MNMKTTKNHNKTSLLATIFLSCAVLVAFMQLSASAQTLVNRYSFTDDGTHSNIVDSVGGTNWYGTLPNGGDLVDVPGQLILASSSDQYVQLPAGVLSNYTAVTIDCWATFGTLPNNCFLYGFGNTDAGGAGEDYIFCQPQNGRIAISGVDPGYQGEEGTGGAGNFSGLTLHVTSVYNPGSGYEQLYTNGVLVSENDGITIPMSSVNDVLNYIGRSLYTGDSYMDVELNEFRIWNGSLNPLQVAGCDVAGPDTVGTAADAGAVTNIQFTIPFYQLVQGGGEAGTVIGETASFPYPVTITHLATFSSSNTNVLTINSTNNEIQAVGQGSANIIASFGGVSATQTITVVQPVSFLAHRYSFSDTDNGNGNIGSSIADSVGGSAWNGTLPNGGSLTGSQVSLVASNKQYVQLPVGIISNYTAVTIEAWATFPDTLPGACFFFGFGNTDVGGLGENYIYMQPASGHIGIGGGDPGYVGEQDAGTYGNLSSHTNIHIAAVFNPQANWIAVYTNGVLAGKNLATTWGLNNVSSVLNYIGRSLYNGDSYMDVNVDEFRIYNGALTSQGIAISDAAGANSIPAGVTNGPGQLLSLTIQAPASIQVLQTAPVKLLANYAGLTNWDIIGNSIFPPAGLTVSVSNTNVMSYANGVLTGVSPGTASVVTVYQGITNTATVTVTLGLSPILAHRYSFFNEPDGSLIATDSIAGFNGTMQGSAGITNGQLILPNTTQVSPALDYCLLPNGILTNSVDGIGTNFNDPAVTVEAWATIYPSQGYWAALFDFGYTDGSGLGAYDIHLGQLGGGTVFGISDSDNANNDYQSDSLNTSIRGTTNLHVVVVFNPPGGYLACYTNGVLAAVENGVTISMAGVWGTLNKIGADLWPDPGMQGSVSEFRIYNGVLSPAQVAQTQVLGPTKVLGVGGPKLSLYVSGGNVILSWPTSATGFTLQYSASLKPANWTTAPGSPTVNGGNYTQSVPISGKTLYFQLVN
jgi:hypothetical protein